MYHIPPCQPCFHTIVHIQSLSENALGITDMSTMAYAAKPCIGTWSKVLNVLRLTIWNLPGVDKGMAGTGGNGDDLIICRINLLLSAKVFFKLRLEDRIALEVVRADHRAKGEALLVHAVSQGPQRSWTKLRKVALHWLGEQEVNESNVALEPVPPDPLELIRVVVAKESSQALGRAPEILLIPLTVSHQKISQFSWILCPILPSHGLLAEEPAIVVEVDELIEHVHA